MSDTADVSGRTDMSGAVFCTHCVGETTSKTPGNVSTTNGIGRKFYGNAMPCQECGAVIRTLWWCLVDAPIIPLGSYRYKTLTGVKYGFFGPRQQFYARRLPALHWRQVWPTWGIGLSLAAVVVIAILAFNGHR